ncbi:MAG: hypothetical protein Q9217_004802 [Psora testacea]
MTDPNSINIKASTNVNSTAAAYAKAQCDELAKVLPGKVSFPRDPDFKQSYFSLQETDIIPTCIVTPLDTADVVVAVKSLAAIYKSSDYAAQFAIKGGGHTPWAGSANIASGPVIDMTSIKAVRVDKKTSLTAVGAGARWADVYQTLDSMQLAVSGGRAAQVGVGGLTLGGGLSYFSARKGFVCDNVVNFEIVLADGRVVNANADSNKDLWVALRGGSNNFGIVTRFDLWTFQQGPLWGGVVYYPISTVPNQLEAFYNFANDSDYDDYSAVIQSFGFSGGQGSAAVNGLYYTKPQANPPALQPFTAIQPQIASTMRTSGLYDLTKERGANSPDGLRELYITTTFKNDLSFLNAVFRTFDDTIRHVQNIDGITWSLTFQPIIPAITAKSAPLGGNSLGLKPADGPLVNALLTASWKLASDDHTVNDVAAKFMWDVDQAAFDKGVFHQFVYLNYANKTQDPIQGYGAQNKGRLQAVSKKYDPLGLFQKGVPGGFKLFNA